MRKGSPEKTPGPTPRALQGLSLEICACHSACPLPQLTLPGAHMVPSRGGPFFVLQK